MATTKTSRRPVGPVDWSEVSTLAGYGLTEAEIHAKLELPGALSGNELEAFTAAIHQGRLLSSAEVKQAQHKAALNGQVEVFEDRPGAMRIREAAHLNQVVRRCSHGHDSIK